jgi:hypothetical protein
MKKDSLFFVVFCLFILTISRPANAFVLQGLQPLQPNGVFSAFSASTSSKGTVSLGLEFERSIETDYYRTTAKAGYSVSDRMELLVTFPYLDDLDQEITGFEDYSVGIKQNFFKENTYGPSVAYLLRVSFPTDAEEFSTDGSVGAGLIISKKLGPFTGHLNFLYSEPFDDFYNEQIEIILGANLRAAHDLDILAELYMVDDYYSEEFETYEGRLGYRIKTTDYLYTVLGAGYEFKNRDPEFRLMVSFNLIFGDES